MLRQPENLKNKWKRKILTLRLHKNEAAYSLKITYRKT